MRPFSAYFDMLVEDFKIISPDAGAKRLERSIKSTTDFLHGKLNAASESGAFPKIDFGLVDKIHDEMLGEKFTS